ncbi:MAG: hypothetical protein J3R72DRAFT_518698 [Linnemannia gamsii]|nr:MAG: hypothetical protein J3R72DRAFT_518698 [Linnemannia gamsii]
MTLITTTPPATPPPIAPAFYFDGGGKPGRLVDPAPIPSDHDEDVPDSDDGGGGVPIDPGGLVVTGLGMELPQLLPKTKRSQPLTDRNLPNPFVEEEVSSTSFTWTLSSRLNGNRTAASAKKKLDAETCDGNVQSPELFVDTEDVESDEMAQFGSNTNDDTYSEDHNSLVHFKMLNQDTKWVYEGMDIAKKFREFRLRNCQSFSFARDWIADLTPGSQSEQALPSHIKPVANLVELSTINVNERWPALAAIFERVFASNSYDKVLLAINNEDLTDPVVFYLISIVVSYSHYFAFHSELPQDLNEREAFIGFAWSFIRGALTLTNIETRSLEVLITGVEERKNQNLDLRLDVKQTGQFADGVGFSGANQIYLAEASTLHQPKAEKLKEDEYKLHDFGRKMKAAALSCIELAVRIQMELQKRESEAVPVSYQERVKLNEAIREIQTTTPTPEKPRKRKSSM